MGGGGEGVSFIDQLIAPIVGLREWSSAVLPVEGLLLTKMKILSRITIFSI